MPATKIGEYDLVVPCVRLGLTSFLRPLVCLASPRARRDAIEVASLIHRLFCREPTGRDRILLSPRTYGEKMPLQYPPKVGAILVCTFPSEFTPPEMVKTRPVVVVSPQLKGRPGLVAIVPLSTTAPDPMCAHHCEVPISLMPRSMQASATKVWAKCDMIYTFSLGRLDRFKAGKERGTGRRLYEVGQVDLQTVQLIRKCAAAALGITAEIL